MELIDDSNDEDIFSPTPNSNNGLDGLFHQNQKKSQKSGSSQDLKYQAPTKNETNSKSIEAQEFTPPPPVVINAFTWDGKTYKPVGKLGLTLMSKENQAFMIIFKSKQQVLSRTDLTLEQLKIEQHSANVLGTLDAQVFIFFLKSISLNSNSN